MNCICTCSCPSIVTIQGDTIEVYFRLDDLDGDVIDKIYFANNSLGIYSELPYSSYMDAYCLHFANPDSEIFTPGCYYYDLTAELIGGSRLTLIHKGDFTILKKRNCICAGGIEA